MGRGLEAILSVTAPGAQAGAELRELPIELISPNPRQPRRGFDQSALDALAASLGEQGVLQPILVRPRPGGRYELVAGERRWRAARIAGFERIPALVHDREDAATLEVALIENMAREDLNPIDEARACAALVEELELTREDVGRRVGRSRVAVSNLIRLLDLPDGALELLERGALSEGHGRALLLAEDHAARTSLARSAAEHGWSVRVLEERARESNAGASTATRSRGPSTHLPHPDQEQAADDIAAALGGALGADVRVRPSRGGYRVELSFTSAEEALELARSIRPRTAR
ncbi:MAG TPA: ParB/RepB/Spo0J family partition protein [Solirubrobacteraceae bacterium]|jgi:ParB family chromosome partitioning protein